MEDVVLSLFVDDDLKSKPVLNKNKIQPFCRICHESELESSNTLQAPCACSGTVKFAHRECIQRWCNLKGNITCEICLQNYEAGYTAPKKVEQIAAVAVAIRENFQVPIRRERLGDVENPRRQTHHHSDCSTTDNTTATRCKLVALITNVFNQALNYLRLQSKFIFKVFTLVLLVRNLTEVLTDRTGYYPFTLSTLLILKASGVLLPMYILVRLVTVIQNSLRKSQAFANDLSNSEEQDDEDE